jgi:hypothetical protein
MSEMPQIVVRVPADLKAELEREAKEDGRTLGSLVRLILDRRHHLATPQEKPDA